MRRLVLEWTAADRGQHCRGTSLAVRCALTAHAMSRLQACDRLSTTRLIALCLLNPRGSRASCGCHRAGALRARCSDGTAAMISCGPSCTVIDIVGSGGELGAAIQRSGETTSPPSSVAAPDAPDGKHARAQTASNYRFAARRLSFATAMTPEVIACSPETPGAVAADLCDHPFGGSSF